MADYGSNCGRSWNFPVTVTGQVTPWWGSQYRRTLPPLGRYSSTFGLKTAEEDRAKQTVREMSVELYEYIADLRSNGAINTDDAAALRYLVEGALANLEAIPPLYAKWEDFRCIARGTTAPSITVCRWPLELGDDPASMGLPGCSKSNIGSTQIYTDRYGRNYVCPSEAEVQERKTDRQEVRDLLTNALKWTRCAQFWATTAELRAEARAAGVPPDPTGTFGPGGGGPPEPGETPGYGGLGFYRPPIDPEFPGPALPDLLQAIVMVQPPIVDPDLPDEDLPEYVPPDRDSEPGPDGEIPPAEPGAPPPGEEDTPTLGERVAGMPTWSKFAIGGAVILLIGKALSR